MADALHTLARLRRLELSLARRDLAQALDGEKAAGLALQAALQAPRIEAALLSSAEPGVEAAGFAVWLPSAQVSIERHEVKFQEASIACAQASDEARQAHAAREAVSSVCAARADDARRKAARKLQLELDELGRRTRR